MNWGLQSPEVDVEGSSKSQHCGDSELSLCLSHCPRRTKYQHHPPRGTRKHASRFRKFGLVSQKRLASFKLVRLASTIAVKQRQRICQGCGAMSHCADSERPVCTHVLISSCRESPLSTHHPTLRAWRLLACDGGVVITEQHDVALPHGPRLTI